MNTQGPERSARRTPDETPVAPAVDALSTKARTYRLLFAKSPTAGASRNVEQIIAALIVVNIAGLMLGSVASIRAGLGSVLDALEILTAATFTLEYGLRLWSITAAPSSRGPVFGRLRYAFSFFALVDLVSVVPFYAALAGADIEVVSALRMLRLFKLGRYSVAMQSVVAVFRDKRREFIAALAVLLALLLLASCAIHLAESDAQPEAFASIPDSLWWSIVTVTTVGYGDVTPITPAGKLVAGFVALLALLIVAIPTGIVSAGFYEEFRRRAPGRCPHCGRTASHPPVVET